MITKQILSTNFAPIKERAKEVINQLRTQIGLKPRSGKTIWIKNVEVETNVDEAFVSNIREDDNFIRLNINNGDSWAYWHPKDNFEIIHDFKTDLAYKTKDFLPKYYKQCWEQRLHAREQQSKNADLVWGFRDLPTGQYWNGIYTAVNESLDLYPATREQISDFFINRGMMPPAPPQEFTIVYDPKNIYRLDLDERLINTFQMSDYLWNEGVTGLNYKHFPVIADLIEHTLATNIGSDLYEHFINWLAVVIQRKGKPHTAWVLHGNEGTGKGVLFNQVLSPILGSNNVYATNINTLQDTFNGWMAKCLLTFCDEADAQDFENQNKLSAILRNYITEPVVSVREMRQTARNVTNWTSFIFASNRPQPVVIPPTDRRYNVGNFQSQRYKFPGEAAIEAELTLFTQFMLAHEANYERACTTINTETRREMQKLNLTSADAIAQALITGDFTELWATMPDEHLLNNRLVNSPHAEAAEIFARIMKTIAIDIVKGNKEARLSRDEVGSILRYTCGNIPESPTKLTQLLRHHGINLKDVRRNNKKFRGIKIEWKITPDLICTLRDYLEEAPGLKRIK